jgi:hypothetical protein
MSFHLDLDDEQFHQLQVLDNQRLLLLANVVRAPGRLLYSLTIMHEYRLGDVRHCLFVLRGWA